MIKFIREYFIVVAASAFISAVLFHDFFFGDKLLIFTDIGADTLMQYWPFDRYFGEAVKNLDIDFYSFKIALGSQINGIRPYLNPYYLILYLSPDSAYPYLLPYKATLEYVGAALVWAIYLRYLRATRTAVLVFSLLYGFNGYITTWGQHYSWGFLFTILPVVLIALEFTVRKGKIWPFVIAMTYFLCWDYYFVFIASPLLLIYSFVRYSVENDLELGNIAKFYGRLGIACALSLLLAAWVILPDILQILESPRIIPGNDLHPLSLYNVMHYITYVLKSFSINVLGVGDDYVGAFNYYECPHVYGGLLTLLVIPQLFLYARTKEKIILACAILVFSIFLFSPYASFILNGMSKLSHRQTFVAIAFMLYMASRAYTMIEHNGSANRRLLLGTYLSLLFIFSLVVFWLDWRCPLKIEEPNRLLVESVKVIVLLSSYFFLLMIYSKRRKRFVSWAIFVLVVLELIAMTYPSMNRPATLNKHYLSSKTGYFDYSNEALDHIRDMDGGFYRVGKDYNSVFLNDSLFQDYYGIKAFYALNEPSYIEFLKLMDVPQEFDLNEYRTLEGYRDRIHLYTLMGVKYFLSRHELKYPGFESLARTGDVNIYRNNGVLPLGYAYDKYIPRSAIEKLSDDLKDLYLLKGFIAEENIEYPELAELIPKTDDDLSYESSLSDLRRNSLTLTKFDDEHIEGEINLQKPRMLMLSIPYNEGWRARVNGMKAPLHKINAGFIGLMLNAGTSDVELQFVPKGLYEGMFVSAFAASIILCYIIVVVFKRRHEKGLR